MTTHELAGLLDYLRLGLGSGLKDPVIRAFAEASEAFRELPNQPLKALVKEIRAKPSPGDGGKKGRPAIDLPTLIERVRRVRAGAEPAEALLAEVNHLTVPQMKDVLKAFGQKGTSTRDGNLDRVRAIVRAGAAEPVTPQRPTFDPALVEQGVQTYFRLRDAKGLSIPEVRSQFDPIRHYPKAVVEEMSRRLGYTPDGSRDEVVNRLLSNLEGIKMNQLRGEMILSGV